MLRVTQQVPLGSRWASTITPPCRCRQRPREVRKLPEVTQPTEGHQNPTLAGRAKPHPGKGVASRSPGAPAPQAPTWAGAGGGTRPRVMRDGARGQVGGGGGEGPWRLVVGKGPSDPEWSCEDGPRGETEEARSRRHSQPCVTWEDAYSPPLLPANPPSPRSCPLPAPRLPRWPVGADGGPTRLWV